MARDFLDWYKAINLIISETKKKDRNSAENIFEKSSEKTKEKTRAIDIVQVDVHTSGGIF